MDKPHEDQPPDVVDKPHDALFQALLSDRRRSEDVLRTHLKPWMAELLADELPEALDPSFVGGDLRRSQGDKLLRVTLREGEPRYAYVLLEHKSFPDARTALQLAEYKVRIWKRYAQDQERKLRALPTVIPVVFYHGRRAWTAPGSVREMLGTKDDRLRALELGFGYFFRPLRGVPDEQLASDAETRAGLIALRHSHDVGQEERLRALPEVLAGPRPESEYEKQVVLYVICVWNISVGDLERTAERVMPGRGKAMVGQVAQELIERGEANGLVKGKALGKAEGLVQGEANGLVKGKAEGLVQGEVNGLARALTGILEGQFGTLPRAVRRWIATASASDLDGRITVTLGAKSLADVFPELDLD